MRGAHSLVAEMALAALVAIGCAGCMPGTLGSSHTTQEVANMSEEVTERDRAMARQLGAPDEVLSSLERGAWPSVTARENVRYAEAVEDHLSDRYGETFRATEVTLSRGVLAEADSVTCTVDSGPFAGATCKCTFFPGGAPQDGGPQWSDTYPYVRLHEEYEAAAEAAASSAFGDLPQGTWLCDAGMTERPYPEVENDVHDQGQSVSIPPDASLSVMGPYLDGHVWVYLSPECTLSEKDYSGRVSRMVEALRRTGLDIHWEAHKVTKPLDGASFAWEWADEAVRSGQHAWQQTGDLLGVG